MCVCLCVCVDSKAEIQSVGYYAALILWIISALVSSCYTFTWDVRMDWGLFEKGYLLRRELIYPHKVHVTHYTVSNILGCRWLYNYHFIKQEICQFWMSSCFDTPPLSVMSFLSSIFVCLTWVSQFLVRDNNYYEHEQVFSITFYEQLCSNIILLYYY